MFLLPLVKGMTLEDVKEVLNHGFGVRYVRSVQRVLVRQRKSQTEFEDPLAAV